MEYLILKLIKQLINILKFAINKLKIIYYFIKINFFSGKLNSDQAINIGNFFLEQGKLNIAESIFRHVNPDKGEISKKYFYLGSYLFEKSTKDPEEYLNKFFNSQTKQDLQNINYYPPKLFILKFDHNFNLDEEIKKYIDSNITNSYSDKKQINIYKYYQSEHDIFKLDKFNTLKEKIEKIISEDQKIIFANNLDIKFYINKMWFVKSSKGVDLASHSHPEGVLSGIFYYKVPNNKEPGDLIIHNPRNNIIINDDNNLKNFQKVKNNIIIKPIENTIVLFNSYLKHSVKNKSTNDDRISIPFDLSLN